MVNATGACLVKAARVSLGENAGIIAALVVAKLMLFGGDLESQFPKRFKAIERNPMRMAPATPGAKRTPRERNTIGGYIAEPIVEDEEKIKPRHRCIYKELHDHPRQYPPVTGESEHPPALTSLADRRVGSIPNPPSPAIAANRWPGSRRSFPCTRAAPRCVAGRQCGSGRAPAS